MRFLDTNIILRYLTRDDPIKADACFQLLQAVKAGTEELTTSESVIAEVVYVLSSTKHYNLSHADISARLAPIISVRNLRLPHKRATLRALDLYSTYSFLDFEDCLSIAHMERLGIAEIVSYDMGFDKVAEVTRVEPP